MTKITPQQKATYYEALLQKSVSEIEESVLRKKDEKKYDWMYEVEVSYLNNLKSIKNINAPEKNSQQKKSTTGILFPQGTQVLISRCENCFLDKGEYWEVGFKGKMVHFKKCRGLYYIEFLIQHQSEKVNPLQMERNVVEDIELDKNNELSIVSDLTSEPATDDRTIAEIGKRLRRIENEIIEAKKEGKKDKIKTLEDERKGCEKYLSATTIYGKIKSQCQDDKKNINKISKAIGRALGKIQKEDIELWRHLNQSIMTGQVFSYNPEVKTRWTLK